MTTIVVMSICVTVTTSRYIVNKQKFLYQQQLRMRFCTLIFAVLFATFAQWLISITSGGEFSARSVIELFAM